MTFWKFWKFVKFWKFLKFQKFWNFWKFWIFWIFRKFKFFWNFRNFWNFGNIGNFLNFVNFGNFGYFWNFGNFGDFWRIGNFENLKFLKTLIIFRILDNLVFFLSRYFKNYLIISIIIMFWTLFIKQGLVKPQKLQEFTRDTQDIALDLWFIPPWSVIRCGLELNASIPFLAVLFTQNRVSSNITATFINTLWNIVRCY